MKALTLIVELILVVIVACVVAWLAYHLKPKQEQRRKRKSNEKPDLLVPVITAVAIFGQTEIFDLVEAYFTDPRPHVFTEFKGKEKEILLNFKANNPIMTVAIDFPVPGRVVNIHDLNSPADAVTKQKSILGENTEGSLNNVEFVLNDIKPDRQISFKIFYEPIRQQFFVAGRDRWHMSYSWMHGGVLQTKSQWYLVSTGEIAEPPDVEVNSVIFVPRALSDEELKKHYEQGPKRTILK